MAECAACRYQLGVLVRGPGPCPGLLFSAHLPHTECPDAAEGHPDTPVHCVWVPAQGSGEMLAEWAAQIPVCPWQHVG